MDTTYSNANDAQVASEASLLEPPSTPVPKRRLFPYIIIPIITLPAKSQRILDQIATASIPALFVDVEDEEELLLQTLPLSTVNRNRAKKGVRAFVVSISILFLALLFLGAIIALIIFSTYPIFRIVACIVLFIAISHILSIQVRRIYQARNMKFLSATQLMRSVKKGASPSETDEEGDMKHMKLIRQDTTAYLFALKKKDLKRGHR